MAPYLKGSLRCTPGDRFVWGGQWGESQFSIENGWGAPFEYRKLEPGPAPSGLYSGWFQLDAPPVQLDSVHKELEEDILLSVTPEGLVTGGGQNAYGKYEFRGGFFDKRTGQISLTKQYTSSIDRSDDEQQHQSTIREEFRQILGNDMVSASEALVVLPAVSPALDSATKQQHIRAAELLQQSVPGYRPLLYIDSSSDIHAVQQQLELSSTKVGETTRAEPICWSFDHSSALYERLVYEGLFVLADTPAQLVYVLLAKCSPHHSVFDLSTGSLNLHVSRRLQKMAPRYSLSINSAFDEVVACCNSQHSEHTWLTPPLITLFKQCVTGKLAQLCSAELKEVSTGVLVAGEIGLIVGTVYTSLTGFHRPGTQSCGALQIIALGALLHRQGFTMLDFDDPSEYKSQLGAITIDRGAYRKHFMKHRSDTHPILPRTEHCTAELLRTLIVNCVDTSVKPRNDTTVSKTQQKKLLKRQRKEQRKGQQPRGDNSKRKDVLVKQHQGSAGSTSKRKRSLSPIDTGYG